MRHTCVGPPKLRWPRAPRSLNPSLPRRAAAHATLREEKRTWKWMKWNNSLLWGWCNFIHFNYNFSKNLSTYRFCKVFDEPMSVFDWWKVTKPCKPVKCINSASQAFFLQNTCMLYPELFALIMAFQMLQNTLVAPCLYCMEIYVCSPDIQNRFFLHCVEISKQMRSDNNKQFNFFQ